MSLRTKIRGLREIMQFDNKLYLFITRLFFKSENINVYRYNGYTFLTDHAAGDANGARELLSSDMYRGLLSMIEFDSPINVLDFGSNNGGFPILLGSMGIEIKAIACVEFNPNTFSRLRFNLDLNFKGRYKAFNYAVCDTNRRIDVIVGNGSTGDSIYSNNDSLFGELVPIVGKSFDEIYTEAFEDEDVDLCKIDIEGAEFEIFTGSNYQKLEKCKNVLIEIHSDPNKPDSFIIEKLSRMGFEEVGPNPDSVGANKVHLFKKIANFH